MARSSRSLRNLLPSLVVLALALAGCADAGGTAQGEPAAPADRAATATSAAPLVIHDGGVRIVLSRTPEDAWTTGAPTLLALDGVTLVEKDIEPATVPAEHLAWLGERVRLVGKDGAVCEGTVETLSVLGRVMPHFAMLSGWKGEDPYADDGEDGPRTRTEAPAPEVVADEAWNEAADGRLLTGILRTSGDCAGALWAQPVTAPPPAVSAATDAGDQVRARIVAAMRALPTYQAHQARYEEDAVAQTNDDGEVIPHAARWDETDGASTEVRVVRHGESTFVWAHIAANGGCGTFDAELGVVFAMDARGDGLRLVSDPEIALSSAPLAAADVDGDGRVELLFREGVVRSDGGFFLEEDKLDVPSHDCGC